jgi:hypothetical protein
VTATVRYANGARVGGPPRASTLSGGTTLTDLNNFVDNLRDAGVLADINGYHGGLYVVYDLEDGSMCGPWSYLDLPTAQAWLTYWSQISINRAQADGLSPSRLVAFSSVPGINSPFARDGTTQMTAWITNSFPSQFTRTNTFFPQLFDAHVDSNWGQDTALRLQRFNADGIGYAYTNPNYEDYHGYGTCDVQADIDSIKAWTLYVTNNIINIHTWYDYYEPFCVE